MFARSSFIILLLTGWLGAALELALPFSDHAVLQSGKVLPVWGTALPGAEVRVKLGRREMNTTASASGFWEVNFEASESSERGVRMEVISGDARLVREDLVFGEVWIATGQSNMRWMLKDCKSGKEAMAQGRDAGLRVNNFQGRLHPGSGRFSRELLEGLNARNYYETKGWQQASSKSLAEFSGVAYFFARKLRSELGVPVGVIHLGVGGTPMEAHLPGRSFHNDPELKGLLNEWWVNPKYPRWCRKRAALNLKEWLENPVEGRTPPHPFAPSFLWDAGVAPILPFPVSGVLWYQGESNATEDGGRGVAVAKEVNRRKFEALIGAWRHAWKDEDLPVYYVQLPGLNRDWELFREMQLEVSQEVQGVGMAVSIDVGHPTNVHPIRKRPVGERLARLALMKTYGMKEVATEPQVVSFQFDRKFARIKFDQEVIFPVGEGPIGFEVAGKDRVFYPARGKALGPRIELQSDQVGRVVAIRYAWANDPKCNIVNDEDLPLGPFRSDRWPVDCVKPGEKK